MSRRTAAARSRSRRLAATRAEETRTRERPPEARPRRGSSAVADRRAPGGMRTLQPSTPEDAIRLYRQVTRYNLVMRGLLALALALLLGSAVARVSGNPPPDVISEVGLAFLFGFISIAGVKHYRALYRMRRRGVWSNSGSFMWTMMGAPFGAGDPDATATDRRLLRATVALALALGLVELVAGITHK